MIWRKRGMLKMLHEEVVSARSGELLRSDEAKNGV